MAVLKSQSIAVGNVKSRWEEPYTSEAINRFTRALPRGVYDGFTVQQQSPVAAGVDIAIGTDDQFLVYRDGATGLANTVWFDDSTISLNFSFDASAGPLTLYVWVDVDYQVNQATQAWIRVGGSADRTAGKSVTLAKIIIPMSATTILDSYITQSITDPDTFLAPIPKASEGNNFGLVDQTNYDRIPTQAVDDALTGADAPSSSNVFITNSALLAHPGIPRTTVVTDGTLSTGGNYNGAGALESALTALNAASGGHIYVRQGNYTLSSTLSISKPIKITTELSQGASKAQLTIAAATTLTLAGQIQVENMAFVAGGAGSAIIFQGNVVAESLFTDCATTFTNLSQALFSNCTLGASTTDFSGIHSRFKFLNCVFTNKLDLGSTAATQFDACSLENCLLTGDTDQAILCTNAIDADALKFTNCVVEVADEIGVAGTTPYIDFVLTGGSGLIIDGMHFEYAPSVLDNPALRIRCTGDDTYVTVNDFYLNCNSGDCALDTGASTAAIVADCQGPGGPNREHNTIRFNGLRVNGLTGGSTAFVNSVLIGCLVADAGSTKFHNNVIFDGLEIQDWGAQVVGNAFMVVMRSLSASGRGTITVRDSTIDGVGLDATGDKNFYGVWSDDTAGTARWQILNSTISGFTLRDIRIGANSSVLMDGVRGQGRSGQDSYRWHMECPQCQVTNCYFDNTSGSTLTTILQLGNHQQNTVSGNQLYSLGGTDDAINAVGTGGTSSVFLGNVGTGRITVTNTANHLGIGDGDNNLNHLTINLV